MSWTASFAGAPFITDDPDITKEGFWEFYVAGLVDKAKNQTAWNNPQIEFDYGSAKNLQLHLLIPIAGNQKRHKSYHTGIGDTEIGVKFRFIEEDDTTPQVATFPQFECNTGSKTKNLGNGRIWVKLPLWIQKSWDDWTTYGGGGITINPATGQKTYPFAGWVLQRKFDDTFTFGGELYYQGKLNNTTRSTLILNAGGYLNFSKSFSLLFSAGHSIAGAQNLVSYLGLYWTWE
jgi:hypothetical protein